MPEHTEQRMLANKVLNISGYDSRMSYNSFRGGEFPSLLDLGETSSFNKGPNKEERRRSSRKRGCKRVVGLPDKYVIAGSHGSWMCSCNSLVLWGS